VKNPLNSLLEKKYIYLDVKGFTFPQIIEDPAV
jgi:hypothetical protein